MKKLKEQSKKRKDLQDVLVKLPVRARLVCRMLNVLTIDRFLGLTKDEVCGLKNAGDKTWEAIARLQKRVKRQKKQRR